MAILSKYGVHHKLVDLPNTVKVGLSLMGVQEVVGKGSNKTIMAWRDELNQAFGVDSNSTKIAGYSDDDIPWCGLFQAYVWFKAGKKAIGNPLWARNWATAGVPVAERIAGKMIAHKNMRPSLGDALVFVRNGGGHIGTYICEDATHYGVLGGNQGNRVSIVAIEKSRCIAVRRPVYKITPSTVLPSVVAKVPAKSSLNEA